MPPKKKKEEEMKEEIEKKTDECCDRCTSSVKKDIEALYEPFPESVIRQRKGRGNMILDYLDTPTVIRRIKDVFQNRWTFQVISEMVFQDIKQIVVKGQLTLEWPDGRYSIFSQYGSSDIATKSSDGAVVDLGDDMKAAASDALKKCATLSGVGLFLYDRDKPKGSGGGDALATQGQKNFVAALAIKNKVNLPKKDIDAMTIKEASEFIEKYKG